jgi:hypothetical protein
LLWAMHRKLKVNDRGALYSGRGGLVGKVRHLLSAFACAPWILRTQAHPFRRGNIGRRTYQLHSLCILAKRGLRSRCGST